MNSDGRAPEEPGAMPPKAAPPRIGLGLLAGLGTLALVAVPAFWSGLFALGSFRGCFIECGEPEPGVGVLWAAIAAVLLMLPVVVGVSVARIRRSRGWLWLVGLVAVAAIAAALAQRVV